MLTVGKQLVGCDAPTKETRTESSCNSVVRSLATWWSPVQSGNRARPGQAGMHQTMIVMPIRYARPATKKDTS